MTLMPETLEARWRALIDVGHPEQREVDAASPLRMIMGVSPSNQPYFFIVVSKRPGYPQLSSAITVEVRQRSDGLWTLTLELTDATLTDAFMSLVSEIAHKSSTKATEEAAVSAFLETLSDWQQLLQARRERLSLEALRGLVAELWFGFESGVHGQSLATTVQAWSGPLGGEQDFNFPTPTRQFEVKSIRPGRRSVEISSAEQLDRPDVSLAVVTVEDLPSEAQGLALHEAVTRIRGRINDPMVRADFNRRVAHLAVDLDDPWYREHQFGIRRLTIYEVRDEFPAIRRSQLPIAVSRAAYRLDLLRLEKFIVSDQRISEPRDAIV